MKNTAEILVLIEQLGLDTEQVARAVEIQEETGEDFGRILLQQRAIDETDLLKAQGVLFDLEVKTSLPPDFDTDFTQRVAIGFLKSNRIIPMRTDDDLFIAINDPYSFQPLDDLRKILSLETAR
ncbi:MAG: type II secretion system protein GspE, partial [Desulfobacterales bacterium]|nr:type II secretion system protein GspE [Desulfobacterales bacterium]